MKKLAITLATSALLNGVAFADSDDYKSAIPHLDHAFVIVMENHHYTQIIGNPDAPFINAYASEANLATNYYGVGHPKFNQLPRNRRRLLTLVWLMITLQIGTIPLVNLI